MPWKMLGGEPIGLLSGFAVGGCPGPATPPPPPPGNPPPLGNPPPPPEGPPPPGGPSPLEGGWYGGLYFFIAFPKACLICSCFPGAATVKPTVAVDAMVTVLIGGMSRVSAAREGNIAFGARGLSLIL